MRNQELIPHLFRAEFTKIVAVLCKFMGIEYLQQAEDIAGETFLSALEIWPYNGIPENPAAWLYAVAKNKAKNELKRKAIFTNKVAGILQSTSAGIHETGIEISEKNINDSQLQMLFAICHPSIAPQAQIGLALRVLCGFGIDEISNALLTNKEVISKRLFRAKAKLRREKSIIELPPNTDLEPRLANVLTTLYLLFTEGYYSQSRDTFLREDLCVEAMRLVYLLLQNKQTNQPQVNALMALMCFQSSRFEARKSSNGAMILYEEQDEMLWDRALISKGAYYLHVASQGNELTKYHLEAAIAYWHTNKNDTTEKWKNILQLFDQLIRLDKSPISALNRLYALSKVCGKQQAITEAEQLQLTGNHFYFTLLGVLHTGFDNEQAKKHLTTAYSLAKTKTDKQIITAKMEILQLVQ